MGHHHPPGCSGWKPMDLPWLFFPSPSPSSVSGSPVCLLQNIYKLSLLSRCTCFPFFMFQSMFLLSSKPTLSHWENKSQFPHKSMSGPPLQPYLPPLAPPSLPSSHTDVLPSSLLDTKLPSSFLPQNLKCALSRLPNFALRHITQASAWSIPSHLPKMDTLPLLSLPLLLYSSP